MSAVLAKISAGKTVPNRATLILNLFGERLRTIQGIAKRQSDDCIAGKDNCDVTSLCRIRFSQLVYVPNHNETSNVHNREILPGFRKHSVILLAVHDEQYMVQPLP
jgi:hypothetical protein